VRERKREREKERERLRQTAAGRVAMTLAQVAGAAKVT
jgi:hypothetical protein